MHDVYIRIIRSNQGNVKRLGVLVARFEMNTLLWNNRSVVCVICMRKLIAYTFQGKLQWDGEPVKTKGKKTFYQAVFINDEKVGKPRLRGLCSCKGQGNCKYLEFLLVYRKMKF